MERWLQTWKQQNDGVISIGHPDWIGIRSSARELFSHRLLLPDNLDRTSADAVARMLKEADPTKIVIQGFPLSYSWLVDSLTKRLRNVELFSIWHGSFLQAEEDYAWSSFQRLLHHYRKGQIVAVGFVKKGMAELLASTGVRTGFVMNRVRDIPSAASTPIQDGRVHLGIWGLGHNWRKLPYAMLASFLAHPDWVAHLSGATPRVMEFIKYFGIQAETQTSSIDFRDLPQHLSRMHLNLYVTLSECAPMLPLESLASGAPCLVGPNSHYFEDDEFLKERLVVPYPDKASVIADFAVRAISERNLIIDRYRRYAAMYNDRAQKALTEFLRVER